jgi:regulatory protein
MSRWRSPPPDDPAAGVGVDEADTRTRRTRLHVERNESADAIARSDTIESDQTLDNTELAEQAYRTAFDRGLRALGARDHSRRELERKLARKGVSRELAHAVVDELGERGFQSDARFAESFVNYRADRGYGPAWIRQALQERGVDAELIAELLARPELDWRALAEAARVRKFGTELPPDRAAWERQARFLAQRGYATDVIVRVLDRRD